MKKIMILCRRDDRRDYDSLSLLKELEQVETKNEYSAMHFEELLFTYNGQQLTVTDSASGVDLADYDALFLMGWFKTKALDDVARAVAHYAQANGVAFANSEAYYGRSFTKLSQCVMAALNGVSVTPFLFSMDSGVLLKAAENIAFPLIAKAVAASRGKDNYLVQSLAELSEILQHQGETSQFFILQEFIPNDGDYRILVMGGKVRLVIHRKAVDGGHLNNTSQGGTATLTDIGLLPPRVIEDSLMIAGLFRREVTGVDMICHRDTGKYYFLEANNMPQLATGSYVPNKMQALSDYLGELADGNALRYID